MIVYGQKGQDRWLVEEIMPGKRAGFFLDLAAFDPIIENNTYLLETAFAWKGICIEPNPNYYKKLLAVRRCTCVCAVIDGQEHEVDYVPFNSEMAGIVAEDTDNCEELRAQALAKARNRGAITRVKTVTLEKVLEACRAPAVIDYFSFDVEGAETRILKTFPFQKYRFLAITIERPTPLLNKILLEDNDYLFVKNYLCPRQQEPTESFYIHKSIYRPDIKLEPFSQVPRKRW